MINHQIIQTPRLRAELLDESNQNYIFDLYSHKETLEFLHGVDAARDINLSIRCSQDYKIGAYLIFENDSNEFVGVGGIQKQDPMIDGSFAMQDDDIEFLIVLVHQFKGKGYAAEFCDAFFERFFATFPNLQVPARVDQNNAACVKLLKKLGFSEIGKTHYYVYESKFTLLKNSLDLWKNSKK
jgi:RimJ/RimL family protein N-acetyltransferase